MCSIITSSSDLCCTDLNGINITASKSSAKNPLPLAHFKQISLARVVFPIPAQYSYYITTTNTSHYC